MSTGTETDDSRAADDNYDPYAAYARTTSVDMKHRVDDSSVFKKFVNMAKQGSSRTFVLVTIVIVLLILVYRGISSDSNTAAAQTVQIDEDFLASLQKNRQHGSFPEPFSFVPFKIKECTEMLNSESARKFYAEYLSRRSAFESKDPKNLKVITQEDVQEKEKEVIYYALMKSGHFDTVCTNGLFTGKDDALPILLSPKSSLNILNADGTDSSKSDEIVTKLETKFPNRIHKMSLKEAISANKGKCNLIIVNGKGGGAKALLDSAPVLVNPDTHFILATNMKPGSVLYTSWEKHKGSGKIRKVFSCEFHKITPNDRYLPTVASKIAVGRMDSRAS